MRYLLTFSFLAILLSHNALANVALDPKPAPALRDQNNQKRRYDMWQTFLGLDGWKISYITFEHFIPIEVAAVGLQQLYLTLAVNSFAGQYGSLIPSYAVVLRLGSLNLTTLSNEKSHGNWWRPLRLGCEQRQI